MQLRLIHLVGEDPLTFDEFRLANAAGQRVALHRLDYLLSQFALRRADTGDWVEAGDRYGYVSARQGRDTVTLGKPPKGTYDAVRFTIGLPAEVDASDPNGYPPDHALHPEVNGLHWGWQGGYIYLAAEGRYQSRKGGMLGYSYHLANARNAVEVVVPLQVTLPGHRSIDLSMDVGKLIAFDFDRDGNSTHSREGDPIPEKLTTALRAAFAFREARSDRYHEMESLEQAVPAYGSPHLLRITKRFPTVALPADNPLTREGVQLGERLFHDVRLSKGHEQSCASCHQRSHAFTDPDKQLSVGVEGHEGKRNAMPLFNLAWKQRFFWDGRVSTLRDQVLHPIQDPLEMNASLEVVMTQLGQDDHYPAMFAAAFGSRAITPESLAKALEQFLLTLVSQEAKFDRAARGEERLTPQEQRGLQLFVTEYDPKNGLYGADCFHCHSGNLFTNHGFANNGLDASFEDIGLGKVTGEAADEGKFATPSLRNVAVTGPYMHDGRFATLEEVIDHYAQGVKRSETLDPNLAKHPELGLELSADDRAALIAFLHTLTDERFLQTAPHAFTTLNTQHSP